MPLLWICPEPDKKLCPKCGSKYIGGFKVGTREDRTGCEGSFPAARVLRMDFDTTKGKEGHEKILEEFSGGNADILVGTQMIVKGHDFPNVTLMGILLADLSLYSSDFRAQEERPLSFLHRRREGQDEAISVGMLLYRPTTRHITAYRLL